MASLFVTQLLPLPRWQSNWSVLATPKLVHFQDFKLHKRWDLTATSKKNITESGIQDVPNDDGVAVEPKTSKRAPRRSRKKTTLETQEENSISAAVSDVPQEENTISISSSEDSKKMRRRTRKKATPLPTSLEEDGIVSKTRRRKTKKKIDDTKDPASDAELSDHEGPTFIENIGEEKEEKLEFTRFTATPSLTSLEEENSINKTRRRKTKKKINNMEDQGSDAELSDYEGPTFIENIEEENEEELEFTQGEEDDISFTYSWPPLVCCFGAAQHAFVPSGRPANRLVDYEIHERKKDALWSPTKFVRAAGGPSSGVAVALASLGGRVAFMGKLGDDDYGQTMLYYLNMNNVQTRAIRIDSKIPTAVSRMKIIRRGGLRMTCVKPCAEDTLSRSEINIDVLKEAKMLYFNSSSLLNREMRSTTLRAIKISKKLGGTIFFDLNLPLPLWQSAEETKMFIQQAWNLADIIEVTKQELEFLCGIEPSENFNTKDNDKSKFIHHKWDVIMPLWHENLQVLFVTNGTSKIHYYTEKHNGSVHGMEDAPITPFTSDMSASGDGIVAGLIRMLTVQPHLITDKGYLENSINYAINCGVIDQWIAARTHGFPPTEGMEEELVSDPNGIRSITEMEYRTLPYDPNGEKSNAEMECHQLEHIS